MKAGTQLFTTIETEAHRLGFTHIGITPAVPVPFMDVYTEWVQKGRHADMTYLAREDAVAKRGDPKLILDGCQSIISLALPYHPPKAHLEDSRPGKGRISAYSLTRDYHEIMWGILSELELFIINLTNNEVRLKSYVDTGPILERAYAVSSGIGTIGKNSSLLIQSAGSYFFLAEILTDLEFHTEAPKMRDLCKSCRRCIDACPTQCILPNRTINANRCISYLTIENKGVIPDGLKQNIGDWVFGCEVCQMVCPHNAHPSEQPSSLGDSLLPEFIDLIELFSFDEKAFNQKFKQTPIIRAKRSGMLRNAAVVLGNQHCIEALPTLENALSHEIDPSILDACRWAINQIKDERQPEQPDQKKTDDR